VGLDGQILAPLRLESAVSTAFAVERVKILNIELRAGEGLCKTLVFAEEAPMAKVKLKRTCRVRARN